MYVLNKQFAGHTCSSLASILLPRRALPQRLVRVAARKSTSRWYPCCPQANAPSSMSRIRGPNHSHYRHTLRATILLHSPRLRALPKHIEIKQARFDDLPIWGWGWRRSSIWTRRCWRAARSTTTKWSESRRHAEASRAPRPSSTATRVATRRTLSSGAPTSKAVKRIRSTFYLLFFIPFIAIVCTVYS